MVKIVLGLVEKVLVNGKEVNAKVDTGACRSSICKSLYDELCLGPPAGVVKTKSANKTEVRPTTFVDLELKGKKLRVLLNVADRSRMKYSLLIGKDVLTKGFLVDPSIKISGL